MFWAGIRMTGTGFFVVGLLPKAKIVKIALPIAVFVLTLW